MREQGFWFVNGKGEIVKGETLTYEQYLAVKRERPWMTMTMVRNIGSEDAPMWGSPEEKRDE